MDVSVSENIALNTMGRR